MLSLLAYTDTSTALQIAAYGGGACGVLALILLLATMRDFDRLQAHVRELELRLERRLAGPSDGE